MKGVLIAASLITCTVFSSAQRETCIEDSQQNEVKSFLKFITEKEYSKTPILIIQEPDMSELSDCFHWMFTDTSFIAQSEHENIKNKIRFPTVPQWNHTFIEKAKLIPKDTIRYIFSDRKRGWDYFAQHYGSSFISFSVPILFRDNTLCLFYSSRSCGSLCGYGVITLYQKSDSTWKAIKRYCEWES